MAIIDKVLVGSTFVGALGALIGGTVILAKNTGELSEMYKKFKSSLEQKSGESFSLLKVIGHEPLFTKQLAQKVLKELVISHRRI